MPADKNASDRTWSSGPYVRVGERDQWNALYREFASELKLSAQYPKGVELDPEQIDVLAYNCAYRAIWAYRED